MADPNVRLAIREVAHVHCHCALRQSRVHGNSGPTGPQERKHEPQPPQPLRRIPFHPRRARTGRAGHRRSSNGRRPRRNTPRSSSASSPGPPSGQSLGTAPTRPRSSCRRARRRSRRGASAVPVLLLTVPDWLTARPPAAHRRMRPFLRGRHSPPAAADGSSSRDDHGTEVHRSATGTLTRSRFLLKIPSLSCVDSGPEFKGDARRRRAYPVAMSIEARQGWPGRVQLPRLGHFDFGSSKAAEDPVGRPSGRRALRCAGRCADGTRGHRNSGQSGGFTKAA